MIRALNLDTPLYALCIWHPRLWDLFSEVLERVGQQGGGISVEDLFGRVEVDAIYAYDFSGGMVAANDAARRAAGDAAEERVVVACSDAEVARVLSDPAMMASVILLSLCCPPSTLRVQVQRHFRSRVRAAVS